MEKLTQTKWISKLSKIDYAFQPIVNIYTGNTFAFEALLRNYKNAGFLSIDNVFDNAYDENILHQVDLFLREKAFAKFMKFKGQSNIKLFFNLDNRLFDSQDYSYGDTISILKSYGYSLDDICFEISEKQQFNNNTNVSEILRRYRVQGYKIAVDDCGTGFSGLKMLYYTEPDYIKIDRFFIQNMGNDPRKRLVISTIVSFAHFSGAVVIAEGVETMDEYSLCKEMGCDMVQGYFVQKPQTDIELLKTQYRAISHISKLDKRNNLSEKRLIIEKEIYYLSPVFSKCDVITLFDKFREEKQSSFFPIINHYEEPLGIIRDTAFKDYTFSKFGRQLLENPRMRNNILKFITRIPIADIHAPIEKLIELYTRYNNDEGLIIVNDMKYIGILSAKSLLKIINNRNITLARDQNPLTKLPGNTMIYDYIGQCLCDRQSDYILIYFDFDNFKPFNDTYGFRNGDRILLMFADMLQKICCSENRFAAHIGGDDFFMGIRNAAIIDINKEMTDLTKHFKKNAESFYDAKALDQGFIIAKDRDGLIKKIPLITISLAILELSCNLSRPDSIEEVVKFSSILKKKAKLSKSGIASANIMEYIGMEKSSLPSLVTFI